MITTDELISNIKTRELTFNWPCGVRKVNFSFTKGSISYNLDFTKTYGIYGVKKYDNILADIVLYEGNVYILDHFKVKNPIDVPKQMSIPKPERVIIDRGRYETSLRRKMRNDECRHDMFSGSNP